MWNLLKYLIDTIVSVQVTSVIVVYAASSHRKPRHHQGSNDRHGETRLLWKKNWRCEKKCLTTLGEGVTANHEQRRNLNSSRLPLRRYHQIRCLYLHNNPLAPTGRFVVVISLDEVAVRWILIGWSGALLLRDAYHHRSVVRLRLRYFKFNFKVARGKLGRMINNPFLYINACLSYFLFLSSACIELAWW